MEGSRWDYNSDLLTTAQELQIWDLFEGESLFTGHDQQDSAYRSRAHLAEMISLLGPPPPDLLARGNATSRFFSRDGR
jgi:serine/threonine-protein kinase SRPK3